MGVTSCAVSPAGTWLVSASADRTLKVWDASTGHVHRTLQGHTSKSIVVLSVPLMVPGSPPLLLTEPLRSGILLTGQERRTLQGHKRTSDLLCGKPNWGVARFRFSR